MASPYIANHVTLSSGHVLFADPSKPWTPANFPNLPSTSVAITAQGRAVDGNVSTLTFTNKILYESFEPSAIRPNLTKSLQIGQNGVITFVDPKVGFVSSFSPSFQTPIHQFQPSSIGAPGIQDITNPPADTLTNALGKLDAWIANAFLLQPPPVEPATADSNAFYGGLRWLNFNTFPILDTSIPYVNSFLVIVGDPATSNYLTLEITDSQYFPFRQYRDGLSPVGAPLVQLRIFTDFFPPAESTASYTKLALPSNCIRVLSESGTCVLPSSGKVVAIQKTDANSIYTTLSLYLPGLAIPKDTPIPVYITFLNNTLAEANVTAMSTAITSAGAPGPCQAIPTAATTNSITYTLLAPIYSDLPHLISTPYFSSYTGSYSFKELLTAHAGGIGFPYGLTSPAQPTSALTNYVGSTFAKSYPYTAATQTIQFTGTAEKPLAPGAVWSTSFHINNSAFLAGPEVSTPLVSTLFPSLSAPLNISSVRLINTASTITRYVEDTGLRGLTFSAGRMSVSAAPDTDVVFISSATAPVAQIPFQTSTLVQWNSATFPGDRSTITTAYTYRDATGVLRNPVVSLAVTTTAQDFPLGVPQVAETNSSILTATVLESQSNPLFQKYFYGTRLNGSQAVSTISATPCEVAMRLTNRLITGYNDPITLQTYSTPLYKFRTEPDNVVSTASLSTTRITNLTQISGLYTPTPASLISFDLLGMNFAHTYSASTLARGVFQFSNTDAGAAVAFSTALRVLEGTTPILATPLPQHSLLTLSSLQVPVSAGLYQDPFDPQVARVCGEVNPANPRPHGDLRVYQTLSNLFLDTASYSSFLSSFSTPTGLYGQRVLSLLPRIESPGIANNIGDGVDSNGQAGVGLDVATSSFFIVGTSNNILVSSFVTYDHTSNLSNATYTNFYARELLYTNQTYVHPAGYNFAANFNGQPLGISSNYPDFSLDLLADVNYGYRYATFAYEWPVLIAPTSYRYIYINVNSPSFVSTIGPVRALNNGWPNAPVRDYLTSTMKVRMHVKLLGAYYQGTYERFETSWINCFKEIDQILFDDSIYDVGGSMSVSTIGSNVEYKTSFNRRFYTKLMALVRVGIPQDGGVYSGEPLSFRNISVRASDI